MTVKTNPKRRARALQQDTGWAYAECLRVAREMTEDQIDRLVEERNAAKPASQKGNEGGT